ncbi:MAG TPA: DUF4198 domain-containing protein [Bryobacteraceae bacterium]|nr:DUF4198 domain-containing protein [Bryobacteraceae bacterium]
MRFKWLAAAVCAAPLLAHSLYLLPAKFHAVAGDEVVFSVHNGDAFPESEDAADPARFVDAMLTGGDTRSSIDDFKKWGKATHSAVRLPRAGAYWISLHTMPRALSLEPAKFDQYLRDEGLEWVIDWRTKNGEAQKPSRERYSKYAKTYLDAGAGDVWRKTLGLDIEIVPEADPAALKPGARLPIRLLWHGKPAAGIRVERAWALPDGGKGVDVVGRTDEQGRTAVTLDSAGRWRIHAVAMERAQNDPEADWISYWASMTFEVRNDD